MTRLSRAESQAITRQRLLRAARELFRRDGYAATTVERIAATAGFSKGAVYSNFEDKESIFLSVLEAQGQEGLNELIAKLGEAEDDLAVIEALAAWADATSRSGSWSLTILEHARLVGPQGASLKRQEEVIRGHWRRLGDYLLTRFPAIDSDRETLGALLHEIAYAPAMTLVRRPTAADLMRLALHSLLCSGAEAAAEVRRASR